MQPFHIINFSSSTPHAFSQKVSPNIQILLLLVQQSVKISQTHHPNDVSSTSTDIQFKWPMITIGRSTLRVAGHTAGRALPMTVPNTQKIAFATYSIFQCYLALHACFLFGTLTDILCLKLTAWKYVWKHDACSNRNRAGKRSSSWKKLLTWLKIFWFYY